jgi:hypothetical protein
MEDSYFTVARNQPGNFGVTHTPVNFSIIKPGESLIDDYSETAPEVKR